MEKQHPSSIIKEILQLDGSVPSAYICGFSFFFIKPAGSYYLTVGIEAEAILAETM